MKTKRLGFLVAAALLLVLSVFSTQSNAGVNVNVGINRPPFIFPVPPPMVVIPGTYSYFAPEADIDIVFYQGYWYRPYEGRWFRSRGYNGPWGYITPPRIPRALIGLPPDFRHRYREYPRIKHHDFNRHWRDWERHKHWEKDDRWREGRVREHHDDRHDHRGRGHDDHRGRGHDDHRGR
jgi:hypothetical protein